MSDSGPPKHWPFVIVEPGDFRVPDRPVNKAKLFYITNENVKEALVEELNREDILNGWQGIGFHYVIDREGNILTGRPLDEIAIVGVDGFPDVITIAVYTYSEAATASAQQLTAAITEAFKLKNKSMPLDA